MSAFKKFTSKISTAGKRKVGAGSKQPEEVIVRKGHVMRSMPQVHTQAVQPAPSSTPVEDSPSNSGGLVRRGAIKRKNTKESNSSHAPADRYNTDKSSCSKRFSFDGHRNPSLRYAAPPAHLERYRNGGSAQVEPRPVVAAGKPQLAATGRRPSRFHEHCDTRPITFAEALDEFM